LAGRALALAGAQKRAGRAAVGPWRDEQHAAAKDRIAIEERAGAFRAARGRTLGQALEAVTEEARRRGVSERTLVGCSTRIGATSRGSSARTWPSPSSSMGSAFAPSSSPPRAPAAPGTRSGGRTSGS
jgi:hypothetical protein